MTSRRWSLLAAVVGATLSIRCGTAPAAPGGPTAPVVPLRSFAGATEAEAAMLELEDRRAFDLSILESVTRSSDPAIRERAALALGRVGDPRGRPLLVTLLSDPSPGVQASAAFGSQVLGDPTLTSELIPLLSVRHASVAAAAAKAIGFLARGDGQDALVAAVATAASPEPRATILRSLWRFATPATEAAARRFVTDPDVRVRFGALYALARKPLETSLPVLTIALSDVDADTAAYAERGLGILARKESIPPLFAALEGGKPPLVTNSLVALEAVLEKNPGSAAGKERIARVVTLAGDANPNVAIPALALLRQFAGSDRDVFRRLWSIATTGTGRRRQVALLSATAVLRDNAFPALETAAKSADPTLRATAAEGLGYLSFAKTRPLRATLASDPSPIVRAAFSRSATAREPDVAIAVIAAAEELRSDPAARALVETVYRSPNPLVSRLARRSLLLHFRGDPATFRPVEYRLSRTPADYLSVLAEAKKPWVATVETARGVYRVRLAGAAAPVTVMNFVALARRGFFDGSTFHRVVPNFVIQDGDPTGTGNGGPGYEIRDELNPIEYSEGTLGMALSGPDTGGSQWFVTHAREPHLDGIYTVFGQVVAGLDVVERIEQGDRITRVSVAEMP